MTRLRIFLALLLLPPGWVVQVDDTRDMRRQWRRMSKGQVW